MITIGDLDIRIDDEIMIISIKLRNDERRWSSLVY